MTAPTPNSETIERELAALGEAPPSAEELALLASGDLDHVSDVATMARLAELSEPLAFDDLSELETHRGWRNVEQRLGSSEPAREVDEPPTQTSPIGGGPRRWLFAAIGLAAAAAITVIIVRPSSPEPVDPEQVVQLGEQARATLKTLENGASDTQRAEQLAAEYQQRLEEQGG